MDNRSDFRRGADMPSKFYAVLVLLILPGCATLSELVDDPSVETNRISRTSTDHLIFSMREDNRIIRTELAEDGRLKVCAETQADAISARSSKSGLEIVGKGAVDDAIERQLTLTYARTELSDVVRQLAWNLCNANLNNQLSDPAYASAILFLQEGVMAVLAHRTSADNAQLLKSIADLKQKTEAVATSEVSNAVSRDVERTKRMQEQTKQIVVKACIKAAKGDLEQIKKCA